MNTKHQFCSHLRMLGRPMGASLLLFVLVLVQSALAQPKVSIQGSLYQEKRVSAGESYEAEFTVVNDATEPAEVTLALLDYVTDRGKDLFPAAGSSPWSNANWLTSPGQRLVVPASSRSLVKFRINVPRTAIPGSYHSVVTMTTAPFQSGGGKAIQMRVAYAVQFVTTIPGGRKSAKIVGTECDPKDPNILWLDVQNDGTEVVEWSVTGLPDPRVIRVYPGQTTRSHCPINSLPDGDQKIRLLFDDRDRTLIPIWIEFRKGRPLPPPVFLSAEAQAEQRRRNAPTAHLDLRLNYGNYNKGVNVVGSFNWRRLGVTANSQTLLWGDQVYQMYYSSAYFKVTKALSLNAGASWWGGQRYSTVGAMLASRRTYASVTYMPEFRMLTGYIQQTVFKRVQIGLYGNTNFDTGRREWNASLVIPIF